MHAFSGDPAVKARLLATIDRHIDAGTLRFGATAFSDEGGTPLMIATGGTDLDAYVAAYGYPPALAALLDPLAAMIGEREHAIRFTRDGVALVEPGTDLTPVPAAIILDLLDAPETRDLAPALVEPLAALHRREQGGEIIARAEWSQYRKAIMAASDLPQPRRIQALLDMCEAASWSSRTSRSILVTVAVKWCDLGEFAADPAWSDDDRDLAQRTLHALWQRHGGGEGTANIPALFAAHTPDLAARFEANLARVNAHRKHRVEQLAAIVLKHIGARSVLGASS